MTGKRIILVLLCISMLWCFSGCGEKTTETTKTTATDELAEKDNTTTTQSDVETQSEVEKIGDYKAVITVENYGEIELVLYGDKAPITVANFVKLAKEGFYDGLTFHRVISGFMIQGGDPMGNGTGGSDENIVGEFSNNGYKNDIKHKRGVISMARAMDPNSASSQFFIMHAAAEHLDGDYAAFGEVLSGMEVVDKIAQETPVIDSNGTVLKENQPIIKSIVIKDSAKK